MKLAAIPDTTPVKLTATFTPADHADLALYAALYEETYGRPAEPADLVPAIVRAFLDADRAFKRARKEREGRDGSVA